MGDVMWKSVVGYEGLYQISSNGQVKSLDRTEVCSSGLKRKRAGRALKQDVARNGYKRVCLSKDGQTKQHLTHRLVSSAYLANDKQLTQVNHKDGDKSNNHINNLEWMTYSENHKHAYRKLGREPKFNKESLRSWSKKASDIRWGKL